ncbi:T9SS type A sorting domain-containing protein [Marixanthomonas spongiae]|uniref:Secretion system C-terminal sorting domain-containing protein n=1 Tax=Marixanthomonas spongiae TaxID=2174845 RepID=A0A2U0I213_9FLAO|nr:T9SS type A sorting domain-containing protein [Marixanthomonas spongiae]PVW15135.1 hypothetical protein DDV96_06925 [Marixanthomonas spongiae]
MKIYIFLIITFFLYFTNYAQIDFQNHVIIDKTTSVTGARVVISADLDGDSDQDMIISANDVIGWYENADGHGKFAVLKVITSEIDESPALHAADLDGDGDMDILFSDSGNNILAWVENIDGLGNFSPIRTITTGLPAAIYTADLDGDGDLDVLSAGGAKVAWHENLDGLGNFGPQQVLTYVASSANSVSAADLDGDGDMDIISGSGGLYVAWFENTTGQGDFGLPQSITDRFTTKVYPADIDGDGDMDIVSITWTPSTGVNETVWFENTDGLGTFGSKQAISNPASSKSAFPTDIDGDGDLDVLISITYPTLTGMVVWHENTDGLGTFGPEQIITTLNNTYIGNVFASDLDGDDDIDAFSINFGNFSLAWYENTDGLGDFGDRIIVSARVEDAFAVYAVDIDGDNDIDVLSASYGDDKLAWYENADGQGNFRFAHNITSNLLLTNSVHTGDIDGDGDIDVLGCSSYVTLGKIGWYENTDGLGHFSSIRAISLNGSDDHPTSVYAVDIDGDNDLDVVASYYSFITGKVIWYENLDGLGNFGGPNLITNEASGAKSVFAIDIDNDGDIDILSASLLDNKVAWYENTDGLGSFSNQKIISSVANEASSVSAADLDNDGDVDVMAALFEDDEIVWYENTDGLGNFGPPKTITTNADGASSVYADDLDGDGYLDVMSASRNDSKVAYYKNTDGQGNFGPQRIITTDRYGANSVFAADINGDNKMDVLSANRYGASIDWYENAGPLSVNEIENEISSLALYPNPSNGFVSIHSETKIVSVSVYNKLGQLVMQEDNQEGIELIDLHKLTTGLYFVKLIDSTSKVDVKKAILE